MSHCLPVLTEYFESSRVGAREVLSYQIKEKRENNNLEVRVFTADSRMLSHYKYEIQILRCAPASFKLSSILSHLSDCLRNYF